MKLSNFTHVFNARQNLHQRVNTYFQTKYAHKKWMHKILIQFRNEGVTKSGFDGVYFRVVLDFNSIIKWWLRWAKNKTSDLTIAMAFSIIRITVKSYIIVARLNRKWNLTEYINITLSIHHYSSIQWTTQSWQTWRSSVTWPLHHKQQILIVLNIFNIHIISLYIFKCIDIWFLK